ncbi:hypothetical protein JST97_29935 [bacterium]|nr:hypothetical protein [bacterium]
MKLLLQRSLHPEWQGPFHLELASWDKQLHGFLGVAREACEGRFAPDQSIYWIAQGRAWNQAGPLNARQTFKLAFQACGALVTLECEDEESPYGLAVEGSLRWLDSSLTHLDRQGELWAVSSLNQLYLGPLDQLKSQGPSSIRRFSLSPQHLYFARETHLWRRPLAGGPDQCVFSVSEGTLAYPLWTERGVVVTHEDIPETRLLCLNEGQEQVLWQGPDEWIYATDALI